MKSLETRTTPYMPTSSHAMGMSRMRRGGNLYGSVIGILHRNLTWGVIQVSCKSSRALFKNDCRLLRSFDYVLKTQSCRAHSAQRRFEKEKTKSYSCYYF